VAFRRKKPPAIGSKAPYPGFVEPALAAQEPWRRLPVIRETGSLNVSNPAREFD
jgi:hypothetical protein